MVAESTSEMSKPLSVLQGAITQKIVKNNGQIHDEMFSGNQAVQESTSEVSETRSVSIIREMLESPYGRR
jgi:hypothetical protein